MNKKKVFLAAVATAMMMLSACGSTNTDTVGGPGPSSNNTAPGIEPAQSTAPIPTAFFDAAAVKEQLVITTYAGDQEFIYRPQGFVFVENPTEFDLSLSCYMKLIDDKGIPIAERSQTFHLGANNSTAFWITSIAPDEASESAGAIEYEITDVSQTSGTEKCLLSRLELATSLNDNKNIIIEAKNISDEESGEINAWLFNTNPSDGVITAYSLSGILPSGMQPGETYTTKPYNAVLDSGYKLFFYCEREAALTEGIRMLR